MTLVALRGVCLAGAVLFSLMIGIGGGALSALAGDHPARAIIAGAATFGATLTLALLMIAFLIPAPRASSVEKTIPKRVGLRN